MHLISKEFVKKYSGKLHEINNMSNSMIPYTELSKSKYGDDAVFNELATSSDFLPRLQLFGSNSELVKRGKIPMAHWGVVIQKDQLEDLGEQVDCLPLSWRPKAMRLRNEGEAPLSYFNPKSGDFLTVQEESEIQDSGCSFGPEYLVYLPAVKRYATYFMNTKTARNQATELRALIGRGATLKVKLIEAPKYSWHGPVVTVCQTKFEVPSLEDMKKVLEKFNNPDDSSVDFDPKKLEDQQGNSSKQGNGKDGSNPVIPDTLTQRVR